MRRWILRPNEKTGGDKTRATAFIATNFPHARSKDVAKSNCQHSNGRNIQIRIQRGLGWVQTYGITFSL